jgi:hypothetical protein
MTDHYDSVELSKAKKLSVEFLQGIGVVDLLEGGIAIPYFDEDGSDLFVRQRDIPNREERFLQPSGIPLQPYGLWRLDQARRRGAVYLTEGSQTRGPSGHTIFLRLVCPVATPPEP